MELNSSPLRWIIRGGAALALTAVFFTGCVITSVYPFYTAKDATYDARLVGTWFDADETNVAAAKEFWIFEAGPGQTYQLAMIGADETNRFDAQLFTLGDERFLDLLLRERQAYTAPRICCCGCVRLNRNSKWNFSITNGWRNWWRPSPKPSGI